MPFTDSFAQFKESLAEKLHLAERVGASRGTILNAAKDFSAWLAREVDPANPEQRLLKEMWEVADDNERNAMVSVLVKFVDKDRQGAKTPAQ
jgi:hypothetical protein